MKTFNVINILLTLIIVVLLTMFIMIIVDKIKYNTNFFDKLNKKSILLKWLECEFCQGFWISLFITIIIVIVTKNFSYLFIPFMTASVIWRVN